MVDDVVAEAAHSRPNVPASSTFVPTPSVEATSTGSSIAAIALAENAPPKLPTPPTTSAPWVRSTAWRISATARLPSPMSTPAAAYDVSFSARRPPGDVSAVLHAGELDQLDRHVGVAGRAAARSSPRTGDR